QELQEQALADVRMADTLRETVNIIVDFPDVPPDLLPGEVAIKFGIMAYVSPLPNRELWNSLADEFSASDPDVGYIEIRSDFGGTLTDIAENYDCFYSAWNLLPGNADLSPLLNIDPYLNADPNFDFNDFLAGSFTQVQQNNLTYGYPISIQPTVISYNVQSFADNGITPPATGWTVDMFIDMLE